MSEERLDPEKAVQTLFSRQHIRAVGRSHRHVQRTTVCMNRLSIGRLEQQHGIVWFHQTAMHKYDLFF